MWSLVLAAALGLAAGVLAGLFGVGGGILFVPTLTLVLGLTQLHAEATSLLAILPTAAAGRLAPARVRERPLARGARARARARSPASKGACRSRSRCPSTRCGGCSPC